MKQDIKHIKKVLIISYFFPPCNLPGAQRVYSFARYLKGFGYYPVVITRRWDHKIESIRDVSLACPGDLLIEKKDNYEAHYLPYKQSLKDKIYTRYGENKLRFFRRVLSFVEIILQNFLNRAIPFRNIYDYSIKYIKESKDIDFVIISANPYILFRFGYKISKKTGIPWIADYRDPWTTSDFRDQLLRSSNFLTSKLDSYFEKKWVSTANGITSVSNYITKGIASFLNTKSQCVYNGFEADDFINLIDEEKYMDFTITYVGELYPGQNAEIFIDGFKLFIDQIPGAKVKLKFIGLGYKPEQIARLYENLKGFENYVEYTGRISRGDVHIAEKKSHLLLYIGWKGYKGIVASKLFEYIASGSPIILTPSDHDDAERIIRTLPFGFCSESPEETKEVLKSLYTDFLSGNYSLKNSLQNENILQYSRREQTKKLSSFLDFLSK